jgi:hypothetical protein
MNPCPSQRLARTNTTLIPAFVFASRPLTPSLFPSLFACTVVAGLSLAAAGCLDFVDLSNIPTCYKGTFLCLGTEDDNCHLGERINWSCTSRTWGGIEERVRHRWG